MKSICSCYRRFAAHRHRSCLSFFWQTCHEFKTCTPTGPPQRQEPHPCSVPNRDTRSALTYHKSTIIWSAETSCQSFRRTFNLLKIWRDGWFDARKNGGGGIWHSAREREWRWIRNLDLHSFHFHKRKIYRPISDYMCPYTYIHWTQ